MKYFNWKSQETSKAVKLHLGSGDVYIPGFVNVDVDRRLKADVYDDISRLAKFRNGQADLIYACHVLEHFSHEQVNKVLLTWYRVLSNHGELFISVPDIDRIVEIYKENWTHFQTPGNSPWIGLIYGGQSDKFDYHKTGFNFNWLKGLLESAGFVNIQEYPHTPHPFGVNDASVLQAPFDRPFSLNVKCEKKL
jgi:predicted SAM-dependent methyltransferase